MKFELVGAQHAEPYYFVTFVRFVVKFFLGRN
jgi:hypothetical protein